MTKTQRAVARKVDDDVATGKEFDDLVPTSGHIAKNLRVVYSVRLSPDELQSFTEAAKAHGITVSDFLRSAAQAALRGEVDIEKSAALEEVRGKARELTEALSRL